MNSFSLNTTHPLRLSSPLSSVIAALLAIGMYGTFLCFAPIGLTGLSIDFRYAVATPLLLGALGLTTAFLAQNSLGVFFGLTSTLILFAFPLNALWSSGISEPSIVGGLLPWSDSLGYLSAAQGLLFEGTLSSSGAKRPLFPGLLSILLAITNMNLQITLAILVGINGICAFFLGKLVQKQHGLICGVVTVLILFLFYRRFSGTLLTENLGLALGTLALTFLWIGAVKNTFGLFMVGLFTMTLALSARSGAFFCLPMMVIYAFHAFRNKPFKSWPVVLICSFTILGAGLISIFTVTLLGDTINNINSNFGHMLYGQVVGGKGWTQAAKDFPQASSSEYVSLAIEHFKERPLDLFYGVYSSFRDYFHWNRGAFGYGFIRNVDADSLHLHLRHALYFLGLLGVGMAFYYRRLKENVLLLSMVLGVLLSVPFIPPIDADGLRVYAATVPINAVLIGIVAQPIDKLIRGYTLPEWLHRGTTQPGFPFHLAGGFAFLIVLASTLAPIIFSVTGPAKSGCLTKSFCEKSNFYIDLVDQSDYTFTRVPHVRLDDFRRGLEGLQQFPELTSALYDLPVDTRLYLTARPGTNSRLIFWIQDNEDSDFPLQ